MLEFDCTNSATSPQRLAKWFTTLSPKEKAKIIKDVSQLVLSRRTRMCNFLEYKGAQAAESSIGQIVAASHHACADQKLCSTDSKVVYRRYASLFFIAGCASTDNELITLEIVHRYVEQMDKYYGNVCELDIIFNFQKAYFILDELLLAGEMQESSKKNVLRCISQEDSLEDMEVSATDVSLPSRITHISDVVSPECLRYPQPPQTNSTGLPFRSRKMSPKLDEQLARRWFLHPLWSVFSMYLAAPTSRSSLDGHLHNWEQSQIVQAIRLRQG